MNRIRYTLVTEGSSASSTWKPPSVSSWRICAGASRSSTGGPQGPPGSAGAVVGVVSNLRPRKDLKTMLG